MRFVVARSGCPVTFWHWTVSLTEDDIDAAIELAQYSHDADEEFLDAWTVTGSTDAPVLRDEWGNDWRDITR